jgi:TctA family transporter
MLPLGYLAVKLAKTVLSVPTNILMPMILLFCIVGTFAINNSVFDVVVMLCVGLLAYFMEENDIPIAPAVLGVVLGGMLEENFIFSMIKADGDFLMFFSRPIACALGIFTLFIWVFPLLAKLYQRLKPAQRVSYE